MRLRRLVSLALLLAIATPGRPIDAQPAARIPKIAVLATATQVAFAPFLAAFRQELRELGYIEGKTVLLEVRLADGAAERLPQLARELVALKPDVIVATTDPAIAAVRRETQTIPIAMAFSSDPAGAGFVASLAHPGGNVTGISALSPETSGKRLELLREVVPGLARVALLWDPDSRGCGRAANQVRAGDQPQDRQGARSHDPAIAPSPGGRRDSVAISTTARAGNDGRRAILSDPLNGPARIC